MFKIPCDKSTAIYITDPELCPLFATGAARPFVYVTGAGRENIENAKNIFDCFNLSYTGDIHKFIETKTDILIIPPERLSQKVPSAAACKLTVSTGGALGVKTLTDTLTRFGYSRVQTLYNTHEFAVRGDTVDIFGPGDENPVRVMFFGDTIEALKRVNVSTFATVENLNTHTIIPAADFTEIKFHESDLQDIFTALSPVTRTFVLDASASAAQPKFFERALGNGEDLSEDVVAQQLGRVPQPTKPKEKKLRGAADAIVISFETTKNKAQSFQINTAPVSNYFSALSVLVPELVWNVNTRRKTVLVFVGYSRACENYLDSKGIPFEISTLDDFIPERINIIHSDLGLSFELLDENTIIYSLTGRTTKPPLSPEPVPAADDSPFVLPPVGGLVVHTSHGLGRYLGTKRLMLSGTPRDYIVLQYDGGTFVYLSPDRTGELRNYSGPARRLNRI